MADNRHKYGFRYYQNLSGSGVMPVQEFRIASGYQPTIAAGTIGLCIGDAVSLLADGTMALSEDSVVAESVPWGVIVGFANLKDPTFPGTGRAGSYYVGGTTYSDERTATRVLVVPFSNIVWEIDANNTGSTEAAFRLLVGANIPLIYSRDTSDSNKPKANPLVDVANVTAAAEDFRIIGVSKSQENQDFTGAFVKLLVMMNAGSQPMFTPAGVAGI